MAQLTTQQAFGLALQHHQAGRLPEAEQLYRQILTRQPNLAEALHMLGVIAYQVGRNDVALDFIRRALALKPVLHEAHYNLGVVLSAKGQLDEAIAAYRQAIKIKPGYTAAHINLGIALKDKGQLDEAIAVYRQLVALNPDLPAAHSNLGVALRDNGQLDEAIAACRQAIALNPGSFEAHYNLGNPLKDKGQLDEAIAAYRQAITLKPNLPAAYSNLGVALKDKGDLNEAITACRQAIALKPDLAEAHNTLALLLLLKGDFVPGWKEYEWRWLGSRELRSTRWKFPQPQWDGSDLTGRTIYLHTEQGLGDTLQFIRYVPMVLQRGGKVIVRCQPELRRLLQSVSDSARWLMPDEPLPAFDVHCPLLSLPLAFGTTLQSIPQSVPYLKGNPQDVEHWRQKLNGDHGSFKVGLVWAGYSKNTNDRNRSIPLSLLSPLSQVKGANFYSLQKGEAGRQAKNPPDGLKLVDWTEDLKDFADTAALIANLDLVISVDTAVIHLAGAMGKPVWAMLPFAPDWRWQLDRQDSPWYPTLRLFRQASHGTWDSVIRQVTEALTGLAHHD